jgi:methyltransferase (TIGR00027 family)
VIATTECHYLGRVWIIRHWSDPLSMMIAGAHGILLPSYRRCLSALTASLMRAVHARLDPDPLIDDCWGDRLVPAAVRAVLEEDALAKSSTQPYRRRATAPCAALDESLRSAWIYPNVIVRSRYTEDALREAVSRGTRQYVIIGAGFDSFALRNPAFADGVSVFEIDHPLTQSLKQRRMADCGIAIPDSLHFIAADLAKEDLATVLARTDYQPNLPAFFSWLGVTMYLSRETNLATLRSIAACSTPGSEIVFSYFEESIFSSDSMSFSEMRESGRAIGEPMQSGFDPKRLAEDMRQVGLELLQDLTEAELVERFGRAGEIAMQPLTYSRIALVRVARP